MSNKSPWSDEEVVAPTKEEFENLTPAVKQAFIASLKELIVHETRCNCECHYNSGVMHMAPCCDRTYVQY
jgi:hypothetical protein